MTVVTRTVKVNTMAARAECQVRDSTGFELMRRICLPVEKRVGEQVDPYVVGAFVWSLSAEPAYDQTQHQVVDQICSRIRSAE